jgi:hypothetical protein
MGAEQQGFRAGGSAVERGGLVPGAILAERQAGGLNSFFKPGAGCQMGLAE